MEPFIEIIQSLIPLLLTVIGVILFLLVANWILLQRHPELGNERRLPRQLTMLGFTVAGVVATAITLPVDNSTRNQVIALIGVLLSGVIAFSSATIVANLMAGIVLRVNKSFRTGDFVRTGEHFGRVTERGLLETEIQTENRELVSLSNTYMISNPIAVVRSSGTIISGSLSLGYDIHHSKVRTLLLKAATESGLEEPFVQIIELGDHAITYRVNGLLTEVKSMITARSNLFRAVLDSLHGDGIEIVSPSFMNQRPMPTGTRTLPPSNSAAPVVKTTKPEDIIFDKAEQSEQREKTLELLHKEIAALEEQSKESDSDTKQAIKDQIAKRRTQVEALKSETAQIES